MLVALQLFLLDLQRLLEFEEGVLIVAADLAKQVLLLGLSVLEIPDALVGVFLEQLKLFKHLLVALVEGGCPVSHSLVNKLNLCLKSGDRKQGRSGGHFCRELGKGLGSSICSHG